MKRFIPFLLLFTLLTGSCNLINRERIKGNGNITTEDRQTGQFNSLDINSALRVVLTQESAHKVKVKADQNLQSMIELREKGGTLYISLRDNISISPTEDAVVYVSMPQVKDIDVSGASSLEVTGRLVAEGKVEIDVSGASKATINLRAPEVKLNSSGASELVIAGETKKAEVDAEGASSVKAYELMTEETKVRASGASRADVFASVKLDLGASGASEIRYKGNGAVTSNASGSGSINKVD